MPLEGDRTKCSSMEAKQMTASHATPTIPEIIHSTPSQPPTQTIKPLEAQKPLTLQFLEFFLFRQAFIITDFFRLLTLRMMRRRRSSKQQKLQLRQRRRRRPAQQTKMSASYRSLFFASCVLLSLCVCVCVCSMCVCQHWKDA